MEFYGASQAWPQVCQTRWVRPSSVLTLSETLSENDVTRAEQSLYRIRQELAAKRDEANRAPPTPSKGWMGRFFTADQGIGAELDGLQAMERQMARSLKQLKKRKVSSFIDCRPRNIAYSRANKSSAGPYWAKCTTWSVTALRYIVEHDS